MEFSDYVIYVDESGDHNLVQTNSPYPIFSLAFCIFKKDQYVGSVVPALQNLKFAWFGHDAFVLHERELRKREKPFDVLAKREKHHAFMEHVSELMRAAPMTVIAAVINKERHNQHYADPDNPYELALKFCMERTIHFLRGAGQTDKLTHLIVECRGKKEDAALELEFRRICDGASWVGPINCLDIVFVDKRANSTGLQIADLIARPIGIHVLRPEQENRAYTIIQSKFRRNGAGRFLGFGLKVFPP